MATIVNSIGTAARDYSTPQAWEDARPADIVVAGNSYVGEMYNDSEFTGSLIVSGITTDATHTLTLRCAAGQSFRDHATRATNRLAYDQSKGVGIRSTAAYSVVVQCDVPNVTIDGIQVINTASPSNALQFSATALGSTAQNCILQSKPGAGSAVVRLTDSSQKLVNSLVVVDTAAAAMGGILESAARAVNCTVVRPSNYTASGVAFNSVYGAAVVRNCAIFGFNTDSTGTYAADGHNVTDFTSAPGSTGNLVSKAYANQFQQPSNAGGVEDYRLKTGSDCINAGVTDATNVPSATDIIGTARPQGTAWDVGAWEVAAGGGTTYNVSLAETASAVDTLSAILAAIATVAETGAAVSTSSAVMTATASVAESGSATDSTSTGGATTSASITETGAAAETTGAALIGTASVAEAGAATDAQSGLTVLTATRSDALTASDATSTGGAITSAAVAETAVATDSTSAIAAFLASVAEIGAAVASQSATVVLNAAWSDALNAIDTQSWGGSVISVSLSEALNALDSQSASMVFAASVTESGAALDATSCVLIANASITEVLAALDSTSVQLITSASIAEALSALDTTSVVNLNFIAAKEHILTGRERSTVLVGRERVTVLVGKSRVLVIY